MIGRQSDPIRQRGQRFGKEALKGKPFDGIQPRGQLFDPIIRNTFDHGTRERVLDQLTLALAFWRLVVARDTVVQRTHPIGR